MTILSMSNTYLYYYKNHLHNLKLPAICLLSTFLQIEFEVNAVQQINNTVA